MALLGLGVGKAVIGAIARKVTNIGIQYAENKLTTNDIEQALALALDTAQTQIGELVTTLNDDDRDRFETNVLEPFLGSGIGLEELQKPMTSEVKPDTEVLITAFQQSVSTKADEIEPDLLSNWMRCFVDKYFEQTNIYIRYQTSRKRYLAQLIQSCEDVKFVGIDISTREDHRSAQLLDIFVVPMVTKEGLSAPNSAQNYLQNIPEQLTDKQQELWLEQQQRLDRERGKTISAHEMFESNQNRVVLLGDPGTGKTTLMRYLAIKIALGEGAEVGLPSNLEQLPILVYMRDWAKYPERTLLEQVQAFTKQTLQLDLPAGFFEHWVDGKALLLLDGLDEVADDATRAALVEKINGFLMAHPKNWALITSRPWGYRRDYFRTEIYPHFEMEPFNDTQIQEFIEHWYANRCDTEAEAQRMILDLQGALISKKRLLDLVKNPLLLTMVALIHRYQDTLPKQRYKLYDRAVDTLLIPICVLNRNSHMRKIGHRSQPIG